MKTYKFIITFYNAMGKEITVKAENRSVARDKALQHGYKLTNYGESELMLKDVLLIK